MSYKKEEILQFEKDVKKWIIEKIVAKCSEKEIIKELTAKIFACNSKERITEEIDEDDRNDTYMARHKIIIRGVLENNFKVFGYFVFSTADFLMHLDRVVLETRHISEKRLEIHLNSAYEYMFKSLPFNFEMFTLRKIKERILQAQNYHEQLCERYGDNDFFPGEDLSYLQDTMDMDYNHLPIDGDEYAADEVRRK